MAGVQFPEQWEEPASYPKIQEILGCSPDHGNVDLAYKILGLHSRDGQPQAARPPAHEFLDWCNNTLWKIYIEGGESKKGSVEHRRFLEANRRVLSAVRTIAGIRRPGNKDWQPHKQLEIAVWEDGVCKDAPVDLRLTNWDQNVPIPVDYDTFQRLYGSDRQADTDERAREHRRSGKTWLATTNMLLDAREREKAEWKDLVPCYGFRAEPFFKFPLEKCEGEREILPHTFFANPVPKNEDSLWYSLSILVHDRYDYAKRIKGKLANWFHRQLATPGSDRFRMYCQLLADSAACVDQDDIANWGSQDLLRCLNQNDPNSGLPKEAGYHEMLYLIADYFATEVITFTRPPDICDSAPSSGNPASPSEDPSSPSGNSASPLGDPASPSNDLASPSEPSHSSKRPVFQMRVYGNPSSRQGFSLCPRSQNRKQILLVTDACLRHFQPVTYISPELPVFERYDGVSCGYHIDTYAFEVWDRWPTMPWWPGCEYKENTEKWEWEGDRSTDAERYLISEETKKAMEPSDITMGIIMDPATQRQLQGPYFETELSSDDPLNKPYHDMLLTYAADADTDRFGLELPDLDVRKGWRSAVPGPDEAQDPPLVVAEWRARAGEAEEAKFRSKGQAETRKRAREECAANEGLGFDSDYGWLRVEATEKENKARVWHNNTKRRRKEFY
ncbi:hypothetical protein CORC01_12389 [Colletotrichum orchidophilum]|uniref:Uncharacterized protein n=1 Tax=Colletotrichum orchidophilum TaxID=1209926 RepID=A0A1G4AT38_9PEZI|nr:uncharacterized protein CORC01_12389 [Colletotrichum orchidophilum]OHE92327.1 hypothetical protein CORC01_12389 [Colletotrichum orchidophilum]